MTEAETLHAETDKLNESLKLAEAALKGLNAGVPASVLIKQSDNLNTYLTFEKFDNEWRLCIATGAPNAPPDCMEVQILRNASRAIRLIAAPYLSNLRDAIRIAVLTERERVERATATVERFTKSLLAEKK